MLRILHIIPYYNIYPPKNGGHLRCFNLMDELGKKNIVDVLCYQKADIIAGNGYTNKNITFYNPDTISIPKTLFSFLPKKIGNALRHRWLRRSIKGPANCIVLDFAHIIEHLSKQYKYDFVIFEHLYTMTLAPIVKRLIPKGTTILDAHNIDYKLINNKIARDKTRDIEENLYKVVDNFWACSGDDVNELEQMNKHRITGTMVPNGVDMISKPFHAEKKGLEKKLLFCGSLNYHPNKEGLLWFYENIWPLITKQAENVELTIIGRGDTSPFEHFKQDNLINLIGEVDDVSPYYQQNYIAIVPLLSGSGTRLKILEAMSFGNPIVSTTIGIEGIQATNEQDVLIADKPGDFAQSVISIIQNPAIGEDIRKNAYKLIQSTYDWKVIGEQLNKYLSNY